MTKPEALAEARKRWGDNAWVMKDLGLFMVSSGVKKSWDVHYRCYGEGDSWEAAFADADKKPGMDSTTKLPWSIVPQNDGSAIIAHQYETGKQMNPKALRLVCHVFARGSSLKEDEANARLIVTSVNYHTKLVTVLRGLVDETVLSFGPSSYDTMLNTARALLAKIDADQRKED